MGDLLEVRNVSKSFGNNLVLDRIAFSCKRGEIHALVGENGAGKSTLMKIISGVLERDDGEIIFNDEAIEPKNPLHANELGISIIHQEFNLIPYLTIGENIFLGQQPLKKNGLIDKDKIKRRIIEMSQKLNIHLDSEMYVKDLSVAQQQMVEIMKALNVDAQLIIMDEPTAALNLNEVKFLFEIMRSLSRENKSVIFITHRINEVMEITDRITVLKDGKMVGTIQTRRSTRDEIVSMMVGRQVNKIFPEIKKHENIDALPVLAVNNLSVHPKKKGISFDVYPGEIVTLAGLEGQGQREIIRSLFGLNRIYGGSVKLFSKNVKIRSPKDAVKMGISFLSDDRKQECLCLEQTIYQNISLPILSGISAHGIILTEKREREAASPMVKTLSVKTASIDMDVASLSGGNQQKVALARCLINNPKLLIIHEPTRGIDVNSKLEIYNLLQQIIAKGVAVLMVSSDLLEVINMSHRILVVNDYGIVAEMKPEEATEESIMGFAVGI